MSLAVIAIAPAAVSLLLACACGGSFTAASPDGAADVGESADVAAGPDAGAASADVTAHADAGTADSATGPDRAPGDAAFEGGVLEASVVEASAVDARCVSVDSDAALGFYGCESAGPCPLARPCCLAIGGSHKACENESSCTQGGYSVFRCGDTMDCTEQCRPPQCCAQQNGANLANSACTPVCGIGFLRLCNPMMPGECGAGLSCQAFAAQPTGLFVCR
jgi:hypothetical protein